MLRDQCLEPGDRARMVPAREFGIDLGLESTEPQLVEPRYLALREPLVLKVGERRPAPEAKRTLEHASGLSRLALLQELPPLLEQPLEATGVEVLDRRPET
jgi:hypothetical protein